MCQEDIGSDVFDAVNPSASLFPLNYSWIFCLRVWGDSVFVFTILRLSLAVPLFCIGVTAVWFFFFNCSICMIGIIKFGFVFTVMHRDSRRSLCYNHCKTFYRRLKVFIVKQRLFCQKIKRISLAPGFMLCMYRWGWIADDDVSMVTITKILLW